MFVIFISDTSAHSEKKKPAFAYSHSGQAIAQIALLSFNLIHSFIHLRSFSIEIVLSSSFSNSLVIVITNYNWSYIIMKYNLLII